ncbi:hypothetical protein SEVIR_4G271050v4 [Setaria viridis]
MLRSLLCVSFLTDDAAVSGSVPCRCFVAAGKDSRQRRAFASRLARSAARVACLEKRNPASYRSQGGSIYFRKEDGRNKQSLPFGRRETRRLPSMSAQSGAVRRGDGERCRVEDARRQWPVASSSSRAARSVSDSDDRASFRGRRSGPIRFG